jgi:hypothetical protein
MLGVLTKEARQLGEYLVDEGGWGNVRLEAALDQVYKVRRSSTGMEGEGLNYTKVVYVYTGRVQPRLIELGLLGGAVRPKVTN